MSYCINPQCQERENPEGLEHCRFCGIPLQIGGRYRLLRPLRTADLLRSVEVFVVQQNGGTTRIMKVLLPQNQRQVKRFEREALILQILDHPGVPHSDIDDYFVLNFSNLSFPLHCLVQDLVEGQDLEGWLEENGCATQAQILDWLGQLVNILQVIHACNFIHCDIKPENMILHPDGGLTLVDFGFATPIGESTGEVTMGTLGYIAPEQTDGVPVPQSDFFSLGRSMIHLATGVSLVSLKDTQTGELAWRKYAPRIDPPVADLLDRLAALGLAIRPPSAQAILEALKHIPAQIRRLQRRQVLKSPTVIAATLLVSVVGGAELFIAITGEMFYRWGMESQNQGQWEDSRTALERSIKLNPKNANAHNMLGLSCTLMGDYECATRAYQESVKLNDDSWNTHYNWGGLYDDQKKYPQAEAKYQEALKRAGGRNFLTLNNLSRIKNLSHKYQDAAVLASEGLTQTNIPERRANLLKNLGWAEYGLGKGSSDPDKRKQYYITAQGHLQQSTDLVGDRADAFCLLAQVQERLAEDKASRDSWQSCLLLSSDNPEVKDWRSQILDKLISR